MSKRGRRFRLGRHWVTDEKTGFAEWDDNVVHDWDGVVTRKGLGDGEHPQWRVRSLQDPYPVGLVRPERGLNLPGIGQMTIGNAADECGYWFVVGPSVNVLNYPSVDATNTSFSFPGTTHTVQLPNGIAAGSRIISIVAAENLVTFTWPAGWTEIFDSDNTDVSLSVAWRDIDGTEGFTGSNDFITVTTSGNEATTHISYRIGNFLAASVPEVSTGATGNSTAPDPDNVSPSGGIQDYLSIIVEAHNTGSTDTTNIALDYEDQIESRTNQ
jgi:hypothetical protein